MLTNRGLTFQTFPGEAAFYGPKIDVKLVDVLGRLWQLSTVQFDFKLPQRFGLEYTGEDGQHHQPVMVHRALFGSVERFFGVFIEHYAGAFPMWLAPVQVGLVPISEKHLDYAKTVQQRLEAAGLRVELDASNNKMQGKDPRLRRAEGPLHPHHGRQGIRHRLRQRPRPRQGRRRLRHDRRIHRHARKH